jgi:carboxylesterase
MPEAKRPTPPTRAFFSHTSDSEVGVLVSHGFTGSTGSMLPLARAFAAQGWNVECPTLTGHGTRWEDLVGVPAEAWVADLEAALALLKARSRKVFVVGLSMGGTLALRLAQTDQELAGVMVINHALVFGNPLVPMAGFLKHLLRSVPAIGSDIKAPGVSEPAYDRTPTAGVAEVNRLAKMVMHDFHRLELPLLVFKSREDHVLPLRNATLLMARAPSRDKELVMLENSYHVATLDHDADLITARCLEFVGRIAKR